MRESFCFIYSVYLIYYITQTLEWIACEAPQYYITQPMEWSVCKTPHFRHSNLSHIPDPVTITLMVTSLIPTVVGFIMLLCDLSRIHYVSLVFLV